MWTMSADGRLIRKLLQYQGSQQGDKKRVSYGILHSLNTSLVKKINYCSGISMAQNMLPMTNPKDV